MEIVVAVQKVQAFALVPRETLRLRQTSLRHEGVRKSDHAIIDADVFPQLAGFRQIVSSVWRTLFEGYR